MRGKQECASGHIADVEGVFVRHRSTHGNRDPTDPLHQTRRDRCRAEPVLIEDFFVSNFFVTPRTIVQFHLFEYEMSRAFQVLSECLKSDHK